MNFQRLIAVGMVCAVVSAYATEGEELPKSCAEQLVYLTDHPEALQRTIDNRKELYTPGLRSEWKDARAEYVRTEDGEEVLMIKGFEVMRGFEKPYMTSIARTAASRGGKVVNVGYGIGFIDGEIERLRSEYPITEHHIIELNGDVVRRAFAWRESQPDRDQIFIHHGDWNEVLKDLVAKGVIFDAIAYDAFPLTVDELHCDSVPFLKEVIKLRAVREGTGLITFYMDSPDDFGSNFREFAKELGVGHLSTEKVEVLLPVLGNQYWDREYFFTPTLTQIRYGE